MKKFTSTIFRRIFPTVLLAAILLSALPPTACAAAPGVSFQAPVGYSLGGAGLGRTPYCVAAGDFNRDGKPDLALTITYHNSVSIRFNNTPRLSGLSVSAGELTPAFDPSILESHAGVETAVFVQMRAGVQIALNATTADFDTVSRAVAAFNVRAGDIIKVFIVDDLNSSEGFNPTLLQ